MFSMKKSLYPDDWLAIVELISNEPALYELVKHCPLDVMRRWRLLQVTRGTLICRQHEPCRHFHLILQGRVDVFLETDDGRRYQQANYGKGDMLGELEIFEQRPYICSVEATEDTRLLRLSRDDFSQWLALDNHFNQSMLRTFSQQYYRLSQKAGADNLYTLYQRVALALWEQFETHGSPCAMLDKQQLSHEFAAAPRSINRILHELKEQQIIAVDGEQIRLLDAPRLRAQAGM